VKNNVVLGNIIKKINSDNTYSFEGYALEAAYSMIAAETNVILITNINKKDEEKAFSKLKTLGAKIIIQDNTKTTTIDENNIIIEIANSIKVDNTLNIDATYLFFAPSLSQEIDSSIFKNLYNKYKIAINLSGFMNYIKDNKIHKERYQELNDNLKYLENISLDKDDCFIQEFTHDEDDVAKLYYKKGCKEILVTYYDALFNYNKGLFYRCKYVVEDEINREKTSTITLAAYICYKDNLIEEEALFKATSLACYQMDDKDINNLTQEELINKMIDIGIV